MTAFVRLAPPSLIESTGNRQQVELVDVWAHYESYAQPSDKDVDDLLLDGSHPNDAGHKLIARLLATRIAGNEAEGAP